VDTLNTLSKEELIALVLQLRAIVEEQAEALRVYAKQVEALQQEIADLKSGGPGKKPPAIAPDWVKPNTKPAEVQVNSEPRTRKKRQDNFTFQRREPTQIISHACDSCPECGRALTGGWEYSRHQIVEIPPVEVQVIDHVVMARHCGVCGHVCVPEVDLTGETLGRSHWGHRLVSLIAYLRTIGRLPKKSIQSLLAALLGLEMSVGAISELLHRVARQGQGAYDALLEELRRSPYVNADETGWRQNGQNGYVWSFSTSSLRCYVYDKSRSHEVPERVLTPDFQGVLVSDFYSGYTYYLGLHQRCWVHLLRDVHELKQKYPTRGVLDWAQKLRDIYDRAKAFSSECPKKRCAARLEFQSELLELASPYVNACLPQSVLAKRLVTFEAELFTFVEHPQVPSENNAAERSIRPRVIARKISGGTRSAQGSTTMAILATLFETWRLRGENGLEACKAMLIGSQLPATKPDS
jgi:transposase